MAADDHELDESPHQSPPLTPPPPPPPPTTTTVSVPATASSGTGPTDRGACQGAPEDLSGDSKDTVKELEEEEKQQQEEGSDGIPYDRGWGWMVALGVFVNYVLLMGYIKSSGLFYVELLERFQASASQTALLFALRHAVYGVSGFLVMNVLVSRYTAKRLVFLGGLLMALSAILSSLANQLTLLICLQAGLLGYLRDTTGSYAIVYHLIGLGLVISGGALCFVRPLRRYQQRRQRPGTRSGTAHVT